MTLTGLTLHGSDRTARWLLLASLALNLFFVGIGGALLMRSYGFDTPAASKVRDRSIGGRIERIAARLPQEDAERLRAAYQKHGEPIEHARTAYLDRQELVRAALRSQPFDREALQTALAEMRAARQVSDRQFHDFFVQQSSEMSPTGRQRLADWPSHRKATRQQPKE